MDFGQTVNYTANAVNAYTALSGGGYAPPAPTYDARGNTLRLPRRDGGALDLAWTAFDRLASVNGSTWLRYDALGRLTWVRRPDGQGGNIDEVWSWSGWTLLNRDLLGAGGTLLEQYRYTWGPDLSGSLEGAGGVGGLLAIERATAGSSTWEIRHVHSDANGNVLCLTDAQGQPSARYRYDAFGNALQALDLDSSGWAARNLHRFSTKPEVSGTGLLYYGYRWYDPVTGRWPSRDPIEEAGGVNLYGFVGNDGVGNWDIMGLDFRDEPVGPVLDRNGVWHRERGSIAPDGRNSGGWIMPNPSNNITPSNSINPDGGRPYRPNSPSNGGGKGNAAGEAVVIIVDRATRLATDAEAQKASHACDGLAASDSRYGSCQKCSRCFVSYIRIVYPHGQRSHLIFRSATFQSCFRCGETRPDGIYNDPSTGPGLPVDMKLSYPSVTGVSYDIWRSEKEKMSFKIFTECLRY